MYWWLVIESLSLEWFHGNCLFFLVAQSLSCFFQWNINEQPNRQAKRKTRKNSAGANLAIVQSQCWSALDMNWGLIDLSKKKTDNYTYLRWNSCTIQDRFSPINFHCRQSKFNRNLSKDTFCATFFFKTLLVKKILPWTTEELWRLTRLSMRNFTIEYVRA